MRSHALRRERHSTLIMIIIIIEKDGEEEEKISKGLAFLTRLSGASFLSLSHF